MLKHQMEILQERSTLKYAMLDVWKDVAEMLPEGFTVQEFQFRNGSSFSINGTASADQARQNAEFGDSIRKHKNADDELSFTNVATIGTHLVQNGLNWGWSGDLANGEVAQ